MRIVCPACAATYDVPEGRLVPGRVVRCARCATDWEPVAHKPAADEPVPNAPAVPEPPPEPPPPEPEPVVEPPAEIEPALSAEPAVPAWRAWLLPAAWVLSAVVLLAVGFLALSARNSIMHAWPPSIRAYGAIGLGPKH